MINKIQSNYPAWSYDEIQEQNQLITYRTSPSQGDDPITWQELDNNFEILRYTINSLIDENTLVSTLIKSGTDTENPLELYINGQWKKVEVGPEDSGGTGYRALRVLN